MVEFGFGPASRKRAENGSAWSWSRTAKPSTTPFTTAASGGGKRTEPAMDAFYFSDTDTLFLVFNSRPVAETRDLDGDGGFIAALDSGGEFVSLTVERAAAKMDGDRVSLPAAVAAAARRAAKSAPPATDPENTLRFTAPLQVRAA